MAINKYKLHSVGNLNSSQVRTVPYIFASEDLENYSAVELFVDTDGVRKAKYPTAGAKDIYLAPAVEVYYDGEGNQHFYIGKGEGTRIVQFDQGVRFETSNFDGTPTIGHFASWDATTKKYKIDGATANVSPVGGKVFEIVAKVASEYGLGLPSIRLEVK